MRPRIRTLGKTLCRNEFLYKLSSCESSAIQPRLQGMFASSPATQGCYIYMYIYIYMFCCYLLFISRASLGETVVAAIIILLHSLQSQSIDRLDV